jgi:hypothetical protein
VPTGCGNSSKLHAKSEFGEGLSFPTLPAKPFAPIMDQIQGRPNLEASIEVTAILNGGENTELQVW